MTTLGRVLLAVATIGAVAAAGLAIVDTVTDGSAGVDEWWRALGLPAFAGLFALLAVRPQRGPGLWLLLRGNKVTLAIAGAALGPEGGELLVYDGILAMLLVAALLLTRGWRTDHALAAPTHDEIIGDARVTP